PGRIGADALPRLHLALVALFRDLLVEVDRRQRMDDVGREALGVDHAPAFGKSLPVRIEPFAQARYDPDSGDPRFARFGLLSHGGAPSWGSRSAPPPLPCWRAAAGRGTASPAG